MKKYFAEIVGTFVLVFSGVGAAIFAGSHIGLVGVSAAFGLAVLVMVYVIGPISGCHINPAVTFGVFLSRKIGGKDAIAYVIAQLIGSILAAAAVLVIARGMPGGYDPHVAGLAATGYGLHSPYHYSLAAGFMAEIILTGFLVLTVLGSTDVSAPVGFAGLAVGMVITLDLLVGIPITNCSVNPARSIGTAVFVGGWAVHQLWLFIVAPLIGAAIAAAIYAVIRAPLIPITTHRAEQALPGEQIDRVL